MKKLSLIITTLLIAFMVSAQSPEKFSYQAVIRDGDGFLITESTIGMKVSILQGASPVYVETHTPTTDQNAMVYVEIGTGTSSDDFSAIDWENGIFFLKIETDILGGTNYTLVSTTQILSVPYALHAKSAETVTGTISENDPVFNGSAAAGISGGDVVNWDEAYSWGNHADAGYLQSFSEAQILSISNDTIYLTGGSFVKLPAGFSGSWDDLSDVPANLTTIINNNFEGDYSDLTNVPTNVSAFTNDAGYITNPNDADADPSNELQIISISNDTIYLSNGGNVKLPAGFSGSWDDLSDIPSNLTTIINNNFEGDYSDLTNVPTNVSVFTNDAGYITNANDADADPSNELQIISISNDTIYLSDGGNVKLPAGFSGSWDDLTDIPSNLTTIINNNFEGDYNDLTNVPTNVSAFANDSGYITNPNDADSDQTNELQIISISNDTIYLSDGGNVKLPAGFSGSWDDLSNVPASLTSIINNNFDGDFYSLTNQPIIPIVPTNVSEFVNDAGYITNSGSFVLPKLTTGERNLIYESAQEGTLIYNTTLHQLEYKGQTYWHPLSSTINLYDLTYPGSTHTCAECVAAGGVVTTVTGGYTLCKFAGNNLDIPSGWSQAGNWQRYNVGTWGGDACGRHKSTGPTVWSNQGCDITSQGNLWDLGNCSHPNGSYMWGNGYQLFSLTHTYTNISSGRTEIGCK